MYVTKITEGSLLSCGITFTQNKKVAVGSKDFEYLKKNFDGIFKFDGDPQTKKSTPTTKKVRTKKDT